jgi:hypothetical protein
MQDVDLNWVVDDLWNGALMGVFVWAGFVATVLAVTTFFAGRRGPSG